MKKLFTLTAIILAITVSSCSEFDDSKIWDKLDNLENRISQLEELCKQMNTNISSLQTIVAALQQNDYITNVSPVRKDGEVIGYTITFAHSDTITIYHGEDGKDGEKGADGKDGYTPQIGVMKDTDNIYYWTVDGEWLLDGKGNKIKAVGQDGKDGEDGKDGTNGTNGSNGVDGENGKDGADGVTPRLKIEDDYWYISYDEGKSWEQLGKASGEDGADGADGEDGADGDSIFKSVTQYNGYVYFELSNGSVITIKKATITPEEDKPTEENKPSENEYIKFSDIDTKAVCLKNWDTNGDNELSYAEAAAVKTLEGAVDLNLIDSFPEFQYFVGIRTIPERCFMRGNISRITIPHGVEVIEESAFRYSSLYSIEFLSTLQSIGSSAFYGCSVQEISLPEGLASLGERVFFDCSDLNKISIPSTMKTIEQNTFNGCDNLMFVTLSEGVEVIEAQVFHDCTRIVNFILPSTITDLYSASLPSQIRKLFVKAKTPPQYHKVSLSSTSITLGNGTFLKLYDETNLKIYIPIGTMDTYKAANGWSHYADYFEEYDFENSSIE